MKVTGYVEGSGFAQAAGIPEAIPANTGTINASFAYKPKDDEDES